MRHGASGRRGRNRGNNRNRGGGNNRAQVFDSNGPDVRIRGTAYQIQEKYAALAKDANAAGDYVLAESYSQHAEHYQRIINSWADQYDDQPRTYEPRGQQQEEGDELALPASIVGGAAKQGAETLEDA
jgi:hypothetical protein